VLTGEGLARNSRDCGTPASILSVFPARIRLSGSPVTT
jgi:hypothetical protein